MTDRLIGSHGGLQEATPVTVDTSTGDVSTIGVITADGLHLTPQVSAPLNPTEGEFWISSSDLLLRRYMNANWTVISSVRSYAVTASTAVGANEEIFADTTSNTITLTLPATAGTGDRVKVLDAKGTWGTNKCTVARNGNTIAGLSSDLDLTTPGDSVELVYYSTTTDWRLA